MRAELDFYVRNADYMARVFARYSSVDLRDEDDTQRIPPGGTPGYTIWNIRYGLDLLSNIALNLVLENVLDENYRIHGSGQNEPGRNFIASITYTF